MKELLAENEILGEKGFLKVSKDKSINESIARNWAVELFNRL
ncbi:MAG: hypothetical protein ACOYVK_20810 [Bacillota bacterium]